MIRIGLLGLSFAVGITAAAHAAQQDLVKRGDYLVNTILTCGNCHSPKGPDGRDIEAKAFSGGLSWDEPPFKVTAPNITQDKQTGIGNWSNTDIRRLLRKGVKPDGTPIATIMPTGFYDIITKRDMSAIVAYLRTLKPIKNKVADPIYKMKQVRQIFPGAERPYKEAMFSDRIKHGFYLAAIGHCMECHTPMVKGRRDWTKDLGRGGFEFPGPWGVSVSRNITQSRSKGIAAWTDAEIKRAITMGVDKEGKHLKPPMGYSYYAKMTEADLNDIVAYLRTVPAKE